MNRIQKIGIALVVALTVIGIGFYFSRPDAAFENVEQPGEGAFETPDDFGDGWSLNPFGGSEPDGGTGDETASEKAVKNIENKTFTLNGRVRFPRGTSQDTVQLMLRIRPLELTKKQLQSLVAKLPAPTQKTNRRQLYRPLVKIAGKDVLSRNVKKRTITTDPKGYFTIKNAPSALYEGEIVSKRWAGSLKTPSLQVPGRNSLLTIKAKQKATLKGRVLSSDGNPVPGATLQAGYQGTKDTTDKSGRYELVGVQPGGKIQVEVSKGDSIPLTATLSPLKPGEVRKRNFRLRSGVTFEVQLETPDGQPVTQGRVGVARADTATKREDGYVGLNPKHKGGQGPSRAYPPDDNGVVTMKGLHPGKITMKYLSVPTERGDTVGPPYMSEQKTVTLKPGQPNRTTLTLYRGRKFWITMVDAQTGEVMMEHDVDDITVYDAEGNRMEQAIAPLTSSTKKFSGRLDPRAEKIEVTVQPRGAIFPSEPQKYDWTTKTFTMDDLPDLVVELEPASGLKAKPQPTGGLKLTMVSPVNSSSNRWPKNAKARLYVLEGSSGRVLAARGGSVNPFPQPFRVPAGEHFVYGTLIYDDNRYAFFSQVQAAQKQISTASVRAGEAGTIEGKIALENDRITSRYQLNVSFDRFSDESGQFVSPPGPLTVQTEEDGSFEIKDVPPGVSLILSASPQGGGDRPIPDLTREISPLGSGETRTIILDK